MGANTKIEWTDATWNPVRGCSRVSQGCVNCYAEVMAGRFSKPGQWGHGFAEMRGGKPRWTGNAALVESMLTLPLTWRTPRRIFVNSTSDLFHERLTDEAIDRVFAVMALAHQHTMQVLTKRPARMRAYCSDPKTPERVNRAMDEIAPAHWHDRELEDHGGWPLPNVWLGTSCEDQPTADERIPHLLATPAAVRFVSYEPALGPVDFRKFFFVGAEGGCDFAYAPSRLLGLVICGGESGPHARPMRPDWARSVRDQCQAAGVAYFFKQWGEWAPGNAFGAIEDGPITNGRGDVADWMRRYVVCADRADRLTACSFTAHATDLVYRVGKARAGRLLDGREHSEMPEVCA